MSAYTLFQTRRACDGWGSHLIGPEPAKWRAVLRTLACERLPESRSPPLCYRLLVGYLNSKRWRADAIYGCSGTPQVFLDRLVTADASRCLPEVGARSAPAPAGTDGALDRLGVVASEGDDVDGAFALAELAPAAVLWPSSYINLHVDGR